MRLIDTVAILGLLNPKDRLHKRARDHVLRVASEEDVFVPMTVLLEADLVMKLKGYNYSERELSMQALENRIPPQKIIPSSVSTLRLAMDLQKEGLSYFDSLISALARETGSIVITTDEEIHRIVQTEW